MIVSLRTSAITVSIRKQHHLPENDIKLISNFGSIQVLSKIKGKTRGRILTLDIVSRTDAPLLMCKVKMRPLRFLPTSFGAGIPPAFP
jgi:hypothetical protein